MDQVLPQRFFRDSQRLLKKPDVVIWRYMNLPRFESMLESKCLYFTRVDRFSDRHEAALSKPALEEGLKQGLKFIQAQGISPPTPQEAIELALEYEALANLTVRESVFANCWHRNASESGAMWNVFGREGVAIRSTIGKLHQSTRGMTPEVMVQKVRYIDHAVQDMHWAETFIFNHRLFSFEQEIRSLVMFPSRMPVPGWEVPCDLHLLIDAVHLPPRAGALEEGEVSSLLSAHGLHGKRVIHSEADTIPDYRQKLEEILAAQTN